MTWFERLCIFGIWVGGIAILFILVWGMSGCTAVETVSFSKRSSCKASCSCEPCNDKNVLFKEELQ